MAESALADDLERRRTEPAPHVATRAPLGPAGRLVWDFLTLFAERRYGEANTFLAPGCCMLFPGGKAMTDCTEVPASAAATYRWVKKVFERIDELPAGDGTIVYCHGTLFGQWADGGAFENVRYIDRFVIADGRIADQQVWNDLCLAMQARQAG